MGSGGKGIRREEKGERRGEWERIEDGRGGERGECNVAGRPVGISAQTK